MKLKNKILMVILFVGMLFLFQNDCYAGTQRLNSLDYQVQLNMDGSMEVVETWDIYVSETNTLFKDFELDDEKCSYIYSAQVKDLDTGLDLPNIYQQMYHVTEGYYYALPIEDDKFEIAWGVGLDNSSANKRYQISYTVVDAVKSYQDCSEFYWKFIGTDNGMPANRVTGTIKLPSPVADMEKLRVWAHGPLNGEIYKTANDTVSFYVDKLSSGTMLETRVVVEEPIFLCAERPENKLESILQEETKWANQANQMRKREKNLKKIGIAIYVGIVIFLITKIAKYKKILRETKTDYGEIDIGKYFRDIPREDATPAEAAFLYYIKDNFFYADSYFSNVFSGTLLQLCLRKYISLEKERKKDIKINLLNTNGERLKPTEKTILEFLVSVSGAKQSVTMEEIKKYVKKNYKEFGEVSTKIAEETKQANIDFGYFDEEKKKEFQKYDNWKIVYISIAVFVFMFIPFYILSLISGLECLIIGILNSKIEKKIKVLTEKGQTEKLQWHGLAQYMEDFSMLNEKDIPDLVLWEKYLVYATTFGIAEKVVKQLKMVYPELNDLRDNNNYSFMYLASDFANDGGFFSTLDSLSNSISSSYTSSSGSGSGGGFSSGGGGRWRRW